MSVTLNMKATSTALLVVAGLSWPAQAEMLALRCEGTKIAIPQKKEPDLLKRKGEEDEPDILGEPQRDPVSTDVIVTDQMVYAFGAEFETGYTNEAFVRFGHSTKKPGTELFLEGFFGKINRIAGTLEAEQLKYKKSGWLYLGPVFS
jgi:hypothetical protein